MQTANDVQIKVNTTHYNALAELATQQKWRVCVCVYDYDTPQIVYVLNAASGFKSNNMIIVRAKFVVPKLIF